MPAVKTLTVNASPNRFGNGDATSVSYQVWKSSDQNPGPVTVEGTGTWNGVTCAVQTCTDLTASPQVWVQEVAKTADFIYHFSPAEGVSVRCVITSSGSPIPDLTVKVRGDFDNQ